jgi:hypothetical protein
MSGYTNAGLNFIENQKGLVFIAEVTQTPKKLRAEVVVAPFTLNRLDDDRRYVILVVDEGLLYCRHSLILSAAHIGKGVLGDGER